MDDPDGAAEPRLGGWARYAIYAAPPPDGALGRLGAEWLGRDASGRETPAPARPSFEAVRLTGPEVDRLVSAPARYGFHGTLKAPFRLRGETTAEALDAALAAYASERPPVAAPPLELAAHFGFVALRPAGASPELDARAAEIVATFDAYRAPLSEAERARRRPEGLDAQATALLERWGYPWVMELFRFHLTLTGRMSEDAGRRLAEELRAVFAPCLVEAFRLEEIALFGDPGTGPFQMLRRYRFTGG